MVTVRFGMGSRALLTFAAFIIVIAGLKAAGAILLPLLIAVFLSVLAAPMVLWLERKGISDWIAVTLALVSVLVILLVFGWMLTSAVSGFENALLGYRATFEQLSDRVEVGMARLGIESSSAFREHIGSGSLMRLARSLVESTLVTLSNAVLVAFILMFILLEVAGFPRKVRAALEDPHADLSGYDHMLHEVQHYLLIKTVVSVATGVAAWLFLWLLGVDFALLWGLIAFLLNYIPTFGSLVAAVPPILITMVQPGMGPLHAMVVTAGYLFINTVIGYIVEPQWMGRQLGLSPLVVLISLVFWGWVWGPVGMLLSVPLTMTVKIMLESSDDLRWVAVLLGTTPTRTDDADKSLVARVRLRKDISPEEIFRTGVLDRVEIQPVGESQMSKTVNPTDADDGPIEPRPSTTP